MLKYAISEVAKVTLPMPSGIRILDTYGKVMIGKMKVDIVRMMFMTKFSLRDFCLANDCVYAFSCFDLVMQFCMISSMIPHRVLILLRIR